MKLAIQKTLAELSVKYMENLDAIASKDAVDTQLNIELEEGMLINDANVRDQHVKGVKAKIDNQSKVNERLITLIGDYEPKVKYFLEMMGEEFDNRKLKVDGFPVEISLGILNADAIREHIEGSPHTTEFKSIEDKIIQCKSFLFSYPLIVSRNDEKTEAGKHMRKQLELKKRSTENSLKDLEFKHKLFSEILGQLSATKTK